MEGCHIDNEKEGGNRGTLRNPYVYWFEQGGAAFEKKSTGPV
jgi:hypothetical protein